MKSMRTKVNYSIFRQLDYRFFPSREKFESSFSLPAIHKRHIHSDRNKLDWLLFLRLEFISFGIVCGIGVKSLNEHTKKKIICSIEPIIIIIIIKRRSVGGVGLNIECISNIYTSGIVYKFEIERINEWFFPIFVFYQKVDHSEIRKQSSLKEWSERKYRIAKTCISLEKQSHRCRHHNGYAKQPSTEQKHQLVWSFIWDNSMFAQCPHRYWIE